MGELVLAAKVTHVPSLMLSEHVESLKGTRDDAINALKLLGRRARDRDHLLDTNLGFALEPPRVRRGNQVVDKAGNPER